MIKIEMTEELIKRQKKDKSGYYFKQIGYAYTVDRDGNPSKYPERIEVMLPKDNNEQPILHKPDNYTLAPSSLRVDRYNNLEISFINLVPFANSMKKAS